MGAPQPEERFDYSLQPVRLPVVHPDPSHGILCRLLLKFREVSLRQLSVAAKRTGRIPNLARYERQKGRERESFLLSRNLAHVLLEGFDQKLFHYQDEQCQISSDDSRPIR